MVREWVGNLSPALCLSQERVPFNLASGAFLGKGPLPVILILELSVSFHLRAVLKALFEACTTASRCRFLFKFWNCQCPFTSEQCWKLCLRPAPQPVAAASYSNSHPDFHFWQYLCRCLMINIWLKFRMCMFWKIRVNWLVFERETALKATWLGMSKSRDGAYVGCPKKLRIILNWPDLNWCFFRKPATTHNSRWGGCSHPDTGALRQRRDCREFVILFLIAHGHAVCLCRLGWVVDRVQEAGAEICFGQ